MPIKDLDARRKYAREWMAKRRAEWFAQNGPCVDCGSPDNLELDHVDRAQKIHHQVWSWSATRRNAELAKCQVRCQTCHRRKTNRECYPERKHGTPGMYRNAKCRCVVCREWMRLDRKRWPKKTAA